MCLSSSTGKVQSLYRSVRTQRTLENSPVSSKQNKHELRPEQYQLFHKWYYLAIRELQYYALKDDFRLLATSLFPRIKTKEAREAIGVLEK